MWMNMANKILSERNQTQGTSVLLHLYKGQKQQQQKTPQCILLENREWIHLGMVVTKTGCGGNWTTNVPFLELGAGYLDMFRLQTFMHHMHLWFALWAVFRLYFIFFIVIKINSSQWVTNPNVFRGHYVYLMYVRKLGQWAKHDMKKKR